MPGCSYAHVGEFMFASTRFHGPHQTPPGVNFLSTKRLKNISPAALLLGLLVRAQAPGTLEPGLLSSKGQRQDGPSEQRQRGWSLSRTPGQESYTREEKAVGPERPPGFEDSLALEHPEPQG